MLNALRCVCVLCMCVCLCMCVFVYVCVCVCDNGYHSIEVHVVTDKAYQCYCFHPLVSRLM